MKISIVGGGLGGMATALLLRKQGAEVHIYEQSDKLGGRLAFEQGEGYRIDQGPTIVLLPEMLLELLEEAGISRERIPLIACEPLYRIHYRDGMVFHKWRNREQQAAELDRLFPGESAAFNRYMDDMGRAFTAGKRAFLDRPFLRKRDFYTPRNLLLLAKLRAYRSARSIAARYFRAEKLVDAFSLQTLYIGGAPFRSPALYTLLPYAEHEFGVWYVKGGYASLVPVLAGALQQQGVHVHLGTPVERLHVEGDTCTGIVAQGSLRRCDAVIYNGDFPGIHRLLPQQASPADAAPAARTALDRALRKERPFEPSSGCILVYLGLEREWPDAQAHQFFLPSSLTTGLKQIFNEQRLPDEPSYYIFYPGALDETAAAPGHSVMYMLIPSPPASGQVDWEREVSPLVERVLADAEQRGFPGLRASIRWQSVRTPQDAEADGLYRGGSFGIAPVLSQSARFRPQMVPYPIERLYAVGASVHPGGGVPIVLQGARLLAQHLSKEMSTWNLTPV